VSMAGSGFGRLLRKRSDGNRSATWKIFRV